MNESQQPPYNTEREAEQEPESRTLADGGDSDPGPEPPEDQPYVEIDLLYFQRAPDNITEEAAVEKAYARFEKLRDASSELELAYHEAGHPPVDDHRDRWTFDRGDCIERAIDIQVDDASVADGFEVVRRVKDADTGQRLYVVEPADGVGQQIKAADQLHDFYERIE